MEDLKEIRKKFFQTIKKGDYTKVKKLVKKRPKLVNVRNKYGETPLHWAAYVGRTNILKFLLKNEAEVNAEDNAGELPLDLAKKRGNKAAIRSLKKFGARSNRSLI